MVKISDVCIKRKIRNRFQDLGQKIFVQSDDRADDSYSSLKDRADGCAELKAQIADPKEKPIVMSVQQSPARNGWM